MAKSYDSVEDLLKDIFSYKGKSKKWKRRREKKYLKILSTLTNKIDCSHDFSRGSSHEVLK